MLKVYDVIPRWLLCDKGECAIKEAALKKVSHIQQWVSAFNIFVSVYTERYQSETPQLMKYCKKVRDIPLSHRDWLCYDENIHGIKYIANFG